MTLTLGIDVGATGIKGGLVNLKTGEMVSERIKFPTPESRKPKEMAKTINKIVEAFNHQGKTIGVGFPAVIRNQKTLTASNIDKAWINYPIHDSLERITGCPLYVINDADAAGLAEIEYGVGRNEPGTVILLTLGTGIGSAIFKDGQLLKNTELGHLKYKNDIAEYYVSNTARKREGMSWDVYGKALNSYLAHIDHIFSPKLVILGGGISKKFHEFEEMLDKSFRVKPALKFNNAGIIGAALSWKLYGKK
ncbi:MAG: ROK family protein [Saprospiraceae bacterium]|nr:ROK family protein [Saprospiraceae bacterium]